MTNKKKIYLGISIITITAFLIGISFALWNVNVAQEGINTITSGCLKLTLTDESDAINLRNAYPIPDNEASNLEPYKFKIENTCNSEVSYNISLEMMEIENRLNSEYIAISIDNGTKSILNTLEETNTTYDKGDYTPVEGRMLVNGVLKGNESKSHSIRLWMDESVPATEETMNKTFLAKIVLNATLTGRYVEEILNGAEPVLADNLIPVEIDDTGKVIKANLKSEWYSYEKKKWANAVILEDESITYN